MREVQEKLFDDLIHHQSGEKVEATTTIEFSIGGQTFEMDLAEVNAEAFEEAIRPFREAARPAVKKSGPKKKAAATVPPATGGASVKKAPSTKTADEESQKIRDWARTNGFELSDRGRIPGHVKDAYAAAMHGQEGGQVTHDSLTGTVPPEPQLNFDPVDETEQPEPTANGAPAEEESASTEEPVVERV